MLDKATRTVVVSATITDYRHMQKVRIYYMFESNVVKDTKHGGVVQEGRLEMWRGLVQNIPVWLASVLQKVEFHVAQ